MIAFYLYLFNTVSNFKHQLCMCLELSIFWLYVFSARLHCWCITRSKFNSQILSFEIYHFDTRTPANSRLIHREVVRLVTPGTLLEPLKPDANYLMSIAQGPDSSLGLAWLDLSTGEFHLGVSSLENLEEDLSRINPAEVGGVLQA